MIQLTEENEKSEPFSYWKRFGFFACTTTTTLTVVAAAFVLHPQCLGWLVRALLSARMRKQIQRLKKQMFDLTV